MQSRGISEATARSLTLSIRGDQSLSLRPGEVVRAEVLSTAANSSAVIRVNGAALTVQAEVPVHKGDVLSLRVERQENVVYLKLAGNAVGTTDGVRSVIAPVLKEFGDLQPAAEGIVRLAGMLARVPETVRMNLPEIDMVERFLLPFEKLTGPALKEAVRNGGVFFETKLRILALGMEAEGAQNINAKHIIAADLKAALLRLKETVVQPEFSGLLSPQAGVERKDLLEALNGVLRNIEFYQLQSKLSDSLQFFLPLVWKELRDGEMVLRESRQGGSGDQALSCSINLDLERIGKVRALLLLQTGGIHVSLASESSVFSRLLEQGSELLEKQLESAGIRLGSLSVQHEERIDFYAYRAAGLSIRA